MEMGAREFPQEIVEDVLVRLPVTSLVRFRCASKPCLSLITSSQFIQWHLRYHRDGNSTNKLQSSVVLYRILAGKGLYGLRSLGGGYTEDTFRQARELDCPLMHNEDQNFFVVGYCDGILCLVIDFDSIVLWNPSTRESRTLPLPAYNQVVHPVSEVFGFGYDSLTNDYKLVRLPSLKCRQLFSFCDLQTNVLSLKTNSWRRIQDVPHYFDRFPDFHLAIAFNGGLYWWISTNGVGIDLILRLDLAEETFSEIALPPLNEFGKNGTMLSSWRGSPSVLRDYTVWVLGEAGAWTKLMPLPEIPASDYFPFLEPLCFTNTGKVFIVVGGTKFVLYDPKERTYEKLDICGIVNRFVNMFVYTESLISPSTGIVAELQC